MGISDEDHAQLCRLSGQMKGDSYEDLEEFLLNSALIFHQLPFRIRRQVLHFKRFSNRQGILLISGLPNDSDLPPTPENSERSLEKSSFASELWLGTFGMALGEPIAYMQEKGGELFRNVCPTRRNEDEWSSESSRIFLPFHTETAFHPFMPSYVLLYCLRPDHDKQARTLVASIRDIFPLLGIDARTVLRQPIYETGIDYSFGSATGRKGGGLVTPILYGANDDPFFRYDPDLMLSYSPEGQQAMEELNSCIAQVATYSALAAGDLIIMDNRRTVHARTEFVARYDGLDRWLQRVYLVDSLAPSASDRHNDRIIRTKFES